MDFEILHPEVIPLVDRTCALVPNVPDRAAGNSSSSSEVDYSMDFRTDKVWPDRDSLLLWTREVGRRRNTVLTIGKSWGSKESRHGKVLLTFENYGNHRCRKRMQDRKEECEKRKRKSRVAKSKKSGCKFALHDREVEKNKWRLEVDCGIHVLPPSLERHAFVGRLTEQEHYQ